MKPLLSELKLFLQDASFDYILCGGYAVDLYLKCETRVHSDIDVGVFWEDREKVIRFMKSKNWIIYEAQGGGKVRKLSALEDYDFERRKNIVCLSHNNPRIHISHIEEDIYTFNIDELEQTDLDYVEFLFNERSDNKFIYYWDSQITRELSKAIMKEGSIPYLAPELSLLYKSTNSNIDKNIVDFENTIKKLDSERKQWLNDALITAYPQGHSWINLLDIMYRKEN